MPNKRSSVEEWPVIWPIMDFRETPQSTEKSCSPRSMSQLLSKSRLWCNDFPNPIPGSRQMVLESCPASTSCCAVSRSWFETSWTTFWYEGLFCIVFGSPSICMMQTGAFRSSTKSNMCSDRNPDTSLMMFAPASKAALATSW